MRSITLGQPNVADHPVEVGQRTEAIVLAELVKRGYRVLVPFGVNHRYDFVIDADDGFIRVQCKTGRLRAGRVVFSTKSVQSNTRRSIRRDYAGEADVFLVNCPQTGRTYAVPVEEAPKGYMCLRVEPARNNQAQHIRWAKDYELPA
jgi:hypothetical protein